MTVVALAAQLPVPKVLRNLFSKISEGVANLVRTFELCVLPSILATSRAEVYYA
ncbi:hypothetical protein AB4853_40750 [Bradyrhizobium sp. 1050_B9_N1_2]|uniref:hypothetical protein n=1 Tax=Bradyrhizobium sp. 1050_B9_N1_2 TaxID=3238688 RepID=UPI003EDBB0BE